MMRNRGLLVISFVRNDYYNGLTFKGIYNWIMKFDNWLKEVPADIKEDAVWSLKAYRISLFMTDLSWNDIQPIIHQKLFSLSDQLYRSTGSISANITEGYSRRSHKEQARFYEIALGSTREAKDWYFKSRHILGTTVSNHRIKVSYPYSKATTYYDQ